MALPFPGNSLRLLFRRRRLAALLIAGGLGLMQAPAASAAPFTGVCPVLGITQPSYPSPLPSSVPPPPNTLPLAIPQVPVRVTVGGQELPICAVYMSINESLKSVTQAINELNPLLPPVPPNVLNDLFFPDLRAQPWYTAPGSSFSVAMAKALADNGFWESGGVLQWKNKGQGFLVNENSSNQPTDSNDSAYFLWDEVGGGNNVKGKATVVWCNTQATPLVSLMIGKTAIMWT